MPEKIIATRLIVGMEVHVELATRSKVFSRAPNPAWSADEDGGPNTLTDPVVLGLPGTLPILSESAVDMSIRVGLALNCRINPLTTWDRKSYFYPDLPKGYQISQYPRPVCEAGWFDVPACDEKGFILPEQPATRIRITRAHLEEDAGKLMHEGPGGAAIAFSIVDLNRAGTPLLEIVTEPDFDSADRAVDFARMLRQVCLHLGVSRCVMQRGHMRFEPNINMELTLADGRRVRTPITEVKNLNSFRSLKRAIEHEAREQPERWLADGREFGRGTKQTRGWDDNAGITFLQREKEDAHDYRYFPDPDIPPLEIGMEWVERVRAAMPELPNARILRYAREFGMSTKDAAAIVDEPRVCVLFEGVVSGIEDGGAPRADAGRMAAILILQLGLKRANETGVGLADLPISAVRAAEIGLLRLSGDISMAGADALFARACENPDEARPAREIATELGLIVVRDTAAMEAWCEQVIAKNLAIVEQIRAGKPAAIGRLIGEVMKLSGGKADAAEVRAMLEKRIGL